MKWILEGGEKGYATIMRRDVLCSSIFGMRISRRYCFGVSGDEEGLVTSVAGQQRLAANCIGETGKVAVGCMS